MAIHDQHYSHLQWGKCRKLIKENDNFSSGSNFEGNEMFF